MQFAPPSFVNKKLSSLSKRLNKSYMFTSPTIYFLFDANADDEPN
jgi:hypothetical protein